MEKLNVRVRQSAERKPVNSKNDRDHKKLQLPYLCAHYDNRKNTGNAGTGNRSKEVSLTSKTVNIKLQKKSNFR